MKTCYYITVTIFDNNPRLSYAILNSYNENGVQIDSLKMGYHNGMNALRELEKRMGKVAEIDVNRYCPAISYKTLSGWVED